MHTAYIVSQYPARSETFIAREMQALSSRGHEVTIGRLRWSDTGAGLMVASADVLDLKWNPLDWALGVGWGLTRSPWVLLAMIRDIFRAPLFSTSWGKLLVLGLISLALARELKTRSPTHIRTHFLDTESVASYWINQLLGTPFSITLHTPNTRFPPALLQRVLDRASFCAVTNTDVRDEVGRRFQCDRFKLIRNWIRIPPSRSSSLPLSPPDWRLLAIGRLVEKKGFDSLLNACHILRTWNRPFRCDIIGDGPLRHVLEQQSHNLALESHIQFHGAQPNEKVLRSLHRHDVVVMPSRQAKDGDRDGIPNVLIEAMAYGCVVVASDFAGIPDLVKHGRTGILVPSADPISLARALRLLFDRPRWGKSMRHRAHQYVDRNFNLEIESKKLDHRIREASLNQGQE